MADPDGRIAVELAEGATVADLSLALRLSPALPRIVLVNGREAGDAACIRAGDAVAIFPPLAGGGPDSVS